MKITALLLATLWLTPPLPAQIALSGREAVDLSLHNSIGVGANPASAPGDLRSGLAPVQPRTSFTPTGAFSAGLPAQKSLWFEAGKFRAPEPSPPPAAAFVPDFLRMHNPLALPALLLPARDAFSFSYFNFFRPPRPRPVSRRKLHRPLYRPVSPFGH